MITFKKVRNYQFLHTETVRPRYEFISEQLDNEGNPLYRATWLGEKMEVRYLDSVLGYAETDQGWRDLIQSHNQEIEVLEKSFGMMN